MNEVYLVKVEANANNNKYYKMIPDSTGNSFTAQYGRIGAGCQTASYSMSAWHKKYNEKINKGYVDQTHLVAEVASKSESQYLDIENAVIAQIVSRLQAMARKTVEENYTISSAKVTKAMINEAQLSLNSLMSATSQTRFNEILVELFKIIPRKMAKVMDCLARSTSDFGRIIEREQDLLDVMRGQVVENVITANENSCMRNQTVLQAMGLAFEEVGKKEIDLIKKHLGSSSYKFHQAWKVINLNTQDKFDKFIKNNNINDCKLFWHGSRNENFWSIINTGLMLRPNAVITGKMFGHGIYFSNDADKSLGYTSLSGSRWAGGNSNSAFMALFDVAYGKPYDVYSFDSKYYDLNYNNLQRMCKGADCLHAHGGTGMLRKDEIVVYKEEQMTIKYLVELR